VFEAVGLGYAGQARVRRGYGGAFTLGCRLIEEKIASGATVEDAEELAKYGRPAPGGNSDKYLSIIEDAIA
jgi:hypothetical protein